MGNPEKRLEKFLRGYRKLMLETGITIGGCGCCGSPYPSDLQGYISEQMPFEDMVDGSINHLRTEGL